MEQKSEPDVDVYRRESCLCVTEVASLHMCLCVGNITTFKPTDGIHLLKWTK